MSRKRIAAITELAEGATIKFQFQRGGKICEGFIVCFQGKILAYENLCRHLSITLDYEDNRFFTGDGRHIICQTHGALYEPLTGLCTRGPCEGESLKPLAIEVRDGTVWLKS